MLLGPPHPDAHSSWANVLGRSFRDPVPRHRDALILEGFDCFVIVNVSGQEKFVCEKALHEGHEQRAAHCDTPSIVTFHRVVWRIRFNMFEHAAVKLPQQAQVNPDGAEDVVKR